MVKSNIRLREQILLLVNAVPNQSHSIREVNSHHRCRQSAESECPVATPLASECGTARSSESPIKEVCLGSLGRVMMIVFQGSSQSSIKDCLVSRVARLRITGKASSSTLAVIARLRSHGELSTGSWIARLRSPHELTPVAWVARIGVSDPPVARISGVWIQCHDTATHRSRLELVRVVEVHSCKGHVHVVDVAVYAVVSWLRVARRSVWRSSNSVVASHL